MPRLARVIVPGVPHHVTQRGNRRLPVFFEEADYQRYVGWLADIAVRYELALAAYCLMPNHVHLVVVPLTETGLGEGLRALHSRYAQAVNLAHDWTGHLWQGRYFACALDDAHLYTAVRYVETNPVRAGLVDVAADYSWSSARAHCEGCTPPPLSAEAPLPDVDDWPAWLAEVEPPDLNGRLRQATAKGLPCGSDKFVTTLEDQVGRRLRVRPVGRPRRADEA